ncbi:hypothetical protein [Leifsonia sp. PS1209]|uniref:hypothetical protein n=1 Tax=Leifsonia sp. PS1209 TaxID=2724914 RepID=UPI001442E2EE|nr:hypothetical protein [Leifsonia sp. PS1209]QIZ97975.1 hypothetical protein HF024_05180 [Leifsonia sp. PS1209]
MKSPLTAIAIAAAATLAVIGIGSPAQASEVSAHIDLAAGDHAEWSPAVQGEYARLLSSADGLLAADRSIDGQRTFDFALAIDAGVPNDIATSWAEGVADTGGIVVNAGPRSFPTHASRAACRGESRVWIDIWGTHVRLNSCVTPTVVTALQGGANAAYIAAAIGGLSGIGAIAGGAIALGGAIGNYSAWSIEQCSRNGTGVELALAGFVCWAQ